MAMEDIEALRLGGIDVPPREVVRLNALALRADAAKRGDDGFTVLPRCSFLGDTCFHEPTIGDEMWIAQASRHFAADDAEAAMYVRAVGISAGSADRPPPTDRRAVRRAVRRFRNAHAAYTPMQLCETMLYALCGADHAQGENPPPKADDAERDALVASGESAAEHDIPPFIAGLVCAGVAERIGTVDDIAKLRESQLRALLLHRAAIRGGKEVYKAEHSQRLGEYYRALDEVKNAALTPGKGGGR